MTQDVNRTDEKRIGQPRVLGGLDQVRMPHSVDAERAVLGSILLNNANFHEVVEFLSEEDFYIEAHKKIWRAISNLIAKGSTADEITVIAELERMGELERVGGAAFVSDLLNYVVSEKRTEQYAQIVHEKSMMRRLILAGIEIARTGLAPEADFEEFLQEAEKLVFEIAVGRPKRAYKDISEALSSFMHIIEERNQSEDLYTGVPSGFTDLDEYTGGFQPSDLIIIAARPRVGKTAFALNVAVNAARYLQQRNAGVVAFFSLEMSAEQLVARIVAAEASVDMSKLRSARRRLDPTDWARISDAIGRLDGLPLVIDDTSMLGVELLRSRCRKLMAERGLSLVIIDYLQLMEPPKHTRRENRERQIAETTRGLKLLAKELKVPIIALSQLNREIEKRSDPHPKLSDLRESGAIEQDADVILFLHRDAAYAKDPDALDEITRTRAELEIAKQRNGPTGKIELFFHPEYTRFFSLAPEEVV